MNLDESNGKPLAVLMLAIAKAAADADAAADAGAVGVAAATASSVSGLSFLPPSPIHVYQRAASCLLSHSLTHTYTHGAPVCCVCVCARCICV